MFKTWLVFTAANAGLLTKNSAKLEIRHTMIPVCKWVPTFLDKYILNWKLRNMYWKGQHTIGCGYNRYK